MPAANASGMPGVNSGATAYPVAPQLGLPGMPGFPAVQQQLQQQQLSNLAGLGGLAALAGSLPDWTRIQELSAPRTRVTYHDEMPESILRRAPSRRNLNKGANQSTPTGRQNGSAPRSTQIQALLDRIEAEENAANQL